jgi:hypothetical protein
MMPNGTKKQRVFDDENGRIWKDAVVAYQYAIPTTAWSD